MRTSPCQTPIALSVFAILSLSAAGCGTETTSTPTGSLPPIGVVGPNGLVVKARAMMTVTAGSPTAMNRIFNAVFPSAFASVTGSEPVTVTNSPSTSMVMSTAQWSVPAITNALLSFGNLDVSSLSDNNLDVCGNNGNSHCSSAVIQMYTTGESGAGLWDTVDQYGAPITAGLGGTTLLSVGLNTAGAATLQTYAIPSTQHVMSFSNFSPAPTYNVKVDFTNAGAGSYSTTIVLEYALSS